MTTQSSQPPSTTASPETPEALPAALRQAPSSEGLPFRKMVLWVLGAVMIAAPTVTLPDEGIWLGVKSFAVQAVGILLAVFVVSRGDWTRERVQAAVLAAPNLLILAFLVWIGISAAQSELPRYSRAEAFRHLGGGLVYIGVLYGVGQRRDLHRFVGILQIAASLGAILAFGNALVEGSVLPAGAFRDKQLFAAFLCLLFPVTLAAALAEEEMWRRVAGQIPVILAAAGILVTNNRSAWAAAAVSGLLLFGLWLRYRRASRGLKLQKHQLAFPLVLVGASLALFLVVAQAGGSLTDRAATLPAGVKDQAVQGRLTIWRAALKMAQDRPILGWGVGTFPIQQALYNPGSREQIVIVRSGSTLAENAHNTYLQLLAELGFPGLALYLGIFVAFFVTAWRSIASGRRGYRQAIVIGAMAGVAAQMVSGIWNPAWEFAECSLFLWAVLGLGMAAAGVAERGNGAAVARA
ncbi:MAG TPA: O-antigen ligase family protein [Armatimonadota bacterium]|nr:O-antigen ligase family protein [Armatimonadota bacterium]